MGAARKLTKVGNSYAAIIPRQIMAVVGIDPDTPYEIATDGHDLIIRPVRRPRRGASARDRAFDAALDRFTRRYRKTIITLAGG